MNMYLCWSDLMPKCPCCLKEIDYLLNEVPGTDKYIFEVKNGNPKYSKASGRTACDPEFECPKCNGIIFFSEEEAIAFLKGEKVIE